MRAVLLFSARSARTIVGIIALCSACSSQPSRNAEQDPNTRAKSRATGLGPQANEEARLADKAKAKDDALVFVRLAQNACRELTRKTEALTANSIVDSSEMNSFMPPDLYPPDSFAAYVDEAALADVKSRLTQLVSSLVELLRSLERNQRTSITGIERQPDEVIKDRAAFQEKKLKTVVSTTMYCESLRRAGPRD